MIASSMDLSGVTPTQWNMSELILLSKKGERAEVDNYRSISLAANLDKLFMKIIENRIYNILDHHQTVEQGGLRRNYTTIIYQSLIKS